MPSPASTGRGRDGGTSEGDQLVSLEKNCRSQAAAGYCRLNTSDCTSGAYYGEVGLDECGTGPCGGQNQEWTAIKSKASKGGFVFKSALEGSTASAKCYMLNIPADLSLGSAQVVAFGDTSCDTGSTQSDFVSAGSGVLETKGFPTPACSSRDGCCVQAAPWSNTTSNTTFSPLAMAVCDPAAQPLQQFEFDNRKGDRPGRIRQGNRCLSIKNCALDVGPHTGPQPGPTQCDNDSYQIFFKPGHLFGVNWREYMWRWGSIWGTIGEQHGVLRQFTPPSGSCDPAVKRCPYFPSACVALCPLAAVWRPFLFLFW